MEPARPTDELRPMFGLVCGNSRQRLATAAATSPLHPSPDGGFARAFAHTSPTRKPVYYTPRRPALQRKSRLPSDFSVKSCIFAANRPRKRKFARRNAAAARKKSAPAREGARRSSSHSPSVEIHLRRIPIIHQCFMFCNLFLPHNTYRKKEVFPNDVFLRPRAHRAAHTGAPHGAEADAEQLAERMDCSLRFVADVERGAVGMSIDSLGERLRGAEDIAQRPSARRRGAAGEDAWLLAALDNLPARRRGNGRWTYCAPICAANSPRSKRARRRKRPRPLPEAFFRALGFY